MAKMLRFGGPKLAKGQVTWIHRRGADGKLRQEHARPGDEIPAAEIVADGGGCPPEYYVETGRAEFVTGSKKKEVSGSPPAVGVERQ